MLRSSLHLIYTRSSSSPYAFSQLMHFSHLTVPFPKLSVSDRYFSSDIFTFPHRDRPWELIQWAIFPPRILGIYHPFSISITLPFYLLLLSSEKVNPFSSSIFLIRSISSCDWGSFGKNPNFRPIHKIPSAISNINGPGVPGQKLIFTPHLTNYLLLLFPFSSAICSRRNLSRAITKDRWFPHSGIKSINEIHPMQICFMIVPFWR